MPIVNPVSAIGYGANQGAQDARTAQIVQQIVQQMFGQQGQQGGGVESQGYTAPAAAFPQAPLAGQLPLLEGAKGGGDFESITGQLQQGGRVNSPTPLGTGSQPSGQLAQSSGLQGPSMSTFAAGTGAPEQQDQGFTINAGDVLSGAKQAFNFGGDVYNQLFGGAATTGADTGGGYTLGNQSQQLTSPDVGPALQTQGYLEGAGAYPGSTFSLGLQPFTSNDVLSPLSEQGYLTGGVQLPGMETPQYSFGSNLSFDSTTLPALTEAPNTGVLGTGLTPDQLMGGFQGAYTGLQGIMGLAQAQQPIDYLMSGLQTAGGLYGGASSLGLAPGTIGGVNVGAGIGGVAGLAGGIYGLTQAQNGAGYIQPGLETALGAYQLANAIPATSSAMYGATGGLLGTQAGVEGAAGTSSALSSALAAVGPYAAAAGDMILAGMNIHNLASALDTGDDRGLGAPIGGLIGMGVGAGAGAIVGSVIAPGYGTLMGALLGAAIGGSGGGALGGLIGQNVPHYFAIREHAQGVANNAVFKYLNDVMDASSVGSLSGIQQALGSQQADGHVRIDLNLPPDVAQALGVAPNARIEDLSQDQFAGLVKAYSERPGYNQDWFIGSGDVPYLPGEQNFSGANRTAQQMTSVAHATFDSIIEAMGQNLDRMPPVAPLHMQNVNGYNLAPELQYSYTPLGVRQNRTNMSYADVVKAAQEGRLNDLWMAGNVGLATPEQRAADAEASRQYFARFQNPNAPENVGYTGGLPLANGA